MRRLMILLLLFYVARSHAQPVVFTEEEFTAVVKNFHPVVRLAQNNIRIARWGVTASRGAFDPQWNSQRSAKNFDGLMYYEQTSHELKIPTWYGIDLHAGRETIDGSRLNPEKTKGSLNYIGISAPLLQNMVIDKRRAAQLLAKNYFELSGVEQQVAVNDLLKEAGEAYWTWWEQYRVSELMQKALENAEKRLLLVRSAYRLGDRPAIDTLEAFTQLQSLQIKAAEAMAGSAKARILLSVFLWTQEGGQAPLPDDVVPEEPRGADTLSLDEILTAAAGHPELSQYDLKLKGLAIKEKLSFQLLLPEVKVKYNQLGRGLSKTVNSGWFDNAYSYGVSVSVPLRLSEGRGEYARARLATRNAQIEQKAKGVQLRAKATQYFIDWQQVRGQLSIQENLWKNLAALQRAEEIRFANGESNLFLINARELKTIEAEQKLIEMQSKNRQALVKLRWSAGLLAR